MIAMNNKYIKFVALAAITIGGYLVIKNLLGKSVGVTKQVGDSESGLDNGKAAVSNYFPLAKGSKGEKVRELQTILVGIDANSLPKYGIDGDFGSETEAALFKYLNKKRVDNQEDIATLNSLKTTAQSKALESSINANRSITANEIINDWKLNNMKNIYASNDLGYVIGNLSASGLELNPVNKFAKKGETIVNGFEIKDMKVLPSGYIMASIGIGTLGLDSRFAKFSPFGVMIK
jgi:hypothetical protein